MNISCSALSLKAKAFLAFASMALCVLSFTAHAASPHDMFSAIDKGDYEKARAIAARIDNPLLIRYATWAAFAGSEVDHVDFDEARSLVKLASHWPAINSVQVRAERAAWHGLKLGRVDADDVEDFCDDYPPISGLGMIACVRAKAGSDAKRRAWLRDGWKQGSFTREETTDILARYGRTLRTEDHRARINRLLYDGQTSAASRLLPLFESGERSLYQARIALRGMARDVNAKVRAVASAYKNDAGLIFDRMRWRHKKGLESGVYEMLAAAPKSPPHADSWWPIRNLYARKALRAGNPKKAVSILQKHGELNRVNMAEARWLIGWISHSFLRDYPQAYETFYALHENVSTPVSLARAAYWASLAAAKNGNKDIAKDWMQRAAKFPNVFYGQLAHATLHPRKPLDLDDDPAPSSSAKAEMDKEELVRMAVQLARYEQKDAVDQFLVHLARGTKDPKRLSLLARLARALGSDFDAVRVAKLALREHISLLEHGWPIIRLPSDLAVAPELALAITRQESEFDAMAKSRAGARGLMQLMPATAKATARKNDMPYSLTKLWEPRYNIVLGSSYLASRIELFDGNYVLAIASYNAGSGNVNKWLKEFGPPPRDLEGRLNWIESIPFAETRNYVQRVMENIQLYRVRLDKDERTSIKQDLLR